MKYWQFLHCPFPQNTNRPLPCTKNPETLFWTAEGAETTPPPSFRRLSSGLTWLDGIQTLPAWRTRLSPQFHYSRTATRGCLLARLNWSCTSGKISHQHEPHLNSHPRWTSTFRGSPITRLPTAGSIAHHGRAQPCGASRAIQSAQFQLHNSLIRIWGFELEYFECKCTSNKEKTII